MICAMANVPFNVPGIGSRVELDCRKAAADKLSPCKCLAEDKPIEIVRQRYCLCICLIFIGILPWNTWMLQPATALHPTRPSISILPCPQPNEITASLETRIDRLFTASEKTQVFLWRSSVPNTPVVVKKVSSAVRLRGPPSDQGSAIRSPRL